MAREYDVVVLGGGLMGAAIGYGLARLGRRTATLDEGDVAFRASRGNFSLVWVQSKGLGMPAYSAWTRRSAEHWPGFAAALKDETGVDSGLQQPGGFTLLLSDAEMERRVAFLQKLHAQPGFETYPYEIWDRSRVRQVFPGIGPEVVGASYCPLDGHLNALRAFRAAHTAFAARGGDYFPHHTIEKLEPLPGGGFRIYTPEGGFTAAKVVLAAGTGNARLGPMLGLHAPVRPQRGQALVTEKASPFLTHPVVNLRQTDEGGIMIGDSQEEAGFDTSLGLGVLAVMARRAARMFPEVGRLNVVRTWSALRVMTKDGFPIYQQSETAPGAFLCNCHSGVTLAAAHADLLAPMIDEGRLDDTLLGAFSTRRFDVPASA